METTEFKFKLTRPAKKLGGDRYEYGKKGDAEWMVIYFPQFISRKGGEIKKELVVTVT